MAAEIFKAVVILRKSEEADLHSMAAASVVIASKLNERSHLSVKSAG